MKINNLMSPETKKLVQTLPKSQKIMAKYVALEESEGSLAHLRFTQDLIVNWIPKVFFARGLADFADMSFLELTENVLIYFGGKGLGEGIFRKLFSKKLAKNLKEKVPVRAEELAKDKSISDSDKKKIMPVKLALALSAMAIPLCEYSLNFIKNVLTLKVFKESDFNNIANLNKVKSEDKTKQNEVKDSAKKHLKIAGGAYAGCLALAGLAVAGRNTKAVQKASEYILTPGTKLFKNEERAKTFNKYFSLDFDSSVVKDKNGKSVLDEFGNEKRKLTLSRGQLVSCVGIGFAGYLQAAKDRGKQNVLEVLFRYPIVTFYVITGADLFIKGFKGILRKKGGYEEMTGKSGDKNFETPKLKDLPELAKKLAAQKGDSSDKAVAEEFKRLFKQKSLLVGVPTIFSLAVMGFFVAGCSKFFTQYRYNKEAQKVKQEEKSTNRVVA